MVLRHLTPGRSPLCLCILSSISSMSPIQRRSSEGRPLGWKKWGHTPTGNSETKQIFNLEIMEQQYLLLATRPMFLNETNLLETLKLT
uniref:Alternative protein SCARB2 n=1 Tax=Homo sapiens TaxID=9606 RepID=L0R538_HUMAN|nr:alternative protein SCARB2 [Homo sapiens]